MALRKHTKQFDKKKQVSEYQLADIVLCKKAASERYHRKAWKIFLLQQIQIDSSQVLR